MNDKPTRRDLMKPVQLLGLAFIAAVFAGGVTAVSLGVFQNLPADEVQRALIIGLIAAGVTFIVVLVSLALLLLAVDPAQVTKQIDRPLLVPQEDEPPATPETNDGPEAPRA
ncbi:hypothetical protein [Microbacterium sp. B19]|uniref:hypothetical protein n=1 Tax=Microbacterium sp. B19 TaxID=96765 RepID=UPI00034CDFEE|nr:hypothetical protein [Microbacterium sp. B19]